MSEQRTWDWDGDGEAQWLIAPDGERVWVDEAAEILARLEADNARMKAALEPFAALDVAHLEDRGDDWPIWGINDRVITVGDVRIARSALSDSREGAV